MLDKFLMIVCVPQRLSQNLETFNVSSQISIILSTTSLSSISLATKNNFANKLLLLSILYDLVARVLQNIEKKKKKKKKNLHKVPLRCYGAISESSMKNIEATVPYIN